MDMVWPISVAGWYEDATAGVAVDAIATSLAGHDWWFLAQGEMNPDPEIGGDGTVVALRFRGTLDRPVPVNPSFFRPVALTIEYLLERGGATMGGTTRTTIEAAGRSETWDGGLVAGPDLYVPGDAGVMVRFKFHLNILHRVDAEISGSRRGTPLA